MFSMKKHYKNQVLKLVVQGDCYGNRHSWLNEELFVDKYYIGSNALLHLAKLLYLITFGVWFLGEMPAFQPIYMSSVGFVRRRPSQSDQVAYLENLLT